MRVLFSIFGIAFFLIGCKTTEPTYYYGAYPEAVYSYFNADSVSVSQQITILEEVIEKAQGKNKPVPPGLHAHLGMLYFETGNNEQGLINFEKEKVLFPESTTYINFLISNNTGAKI